MTKTELGKKICNYLQMQEQTLHRLKRWQRPFAKSVSFLLVLTAVAKLIAILEHKQFLMLPDAVFSTLTTRDSLAIAAVLELVVAVFVFLKAKHLSAMVACSWLVSVFVCYRMLAKAFFYSKPCNCLGGVLDWTGISRRVLDVLPIIILCYIGVGSFCFLFASAAFSSQKISAKDGANL